MTAICSTQCRFFRGSWYDDPAAVRCAAVRPQVTDWLWQAFGGETLPRQFFASIVQHSQTAEALPLTFIAVEGEQLLGTIGLWRCDLISRQDLFPWLAALYVAPAARGQGLAGKLQRHVIDYAAARAFGSSISTPPAGISMNASAGATSARGWITRPPPCTSIAMTYRLPAGRPPSDDGPASG